MMKVVVMMMTMMKHDDVAWYDTCCDVVWCCVVALGWRVVFAVTGTVCN